jgi:catechol 2,3-dioxygenase-like lactoylglutathione lyase family enzyme
MLTEARWTHVAVPSSDLDRSVEFYTRITPLVLVSIQSDDSGRSAWLSNPNQVETPFVLVLAQLVPEVGKQFDLEPGKPTRTFGPFAHIGVELPRKEDVDAVAEKARVTGNLQWEPRYVSEHVGYVCAVTDPDGNMIEFSHNQKVFETIRNLWGEGAKAPASSATA